MRSIIPLSRTTIRSIHSSKSMSALFNFVLVNNCFVTLTTQDNYMEDYYMAQIIKIIHIRTIKHQAYRQKVFVETSQHMSNSFQPTTHTVRDPIPFCTPLLPNYCVTNWISIGRRTVNVGGPHSTRRRLFNFCSKSKNKMSDFHQRNIFQFYYCFILRLQQSHLTSLGAVTGNHVNVKRRVSNPADRLRLCTETNRLTVALIRRRPEYIP